MQQDYLSEAPRTVYAGGLSCGLVTEIKSNPKKFIEGLNAACHAVLDLIKINFSNESISITVDSTEQKDALLALNKLAGKYVEFTRPWSLDRLTLPLHTTGEDQVRDTLRADCTNVN